MNDIFVPCSGNIGTFIIWIVASANMITEYGNKALEQGHLHAVPASDILVKSLYLTLMETLLKLVSLYVESFLGKCGS